MRFRGLLQAFQARPVARAAFFATRLSPAPVFRAALFADLMAFVVLDFLRLAFFMIFLLRTLFTPGRRLDGDTPLTPTTAPD